MVGVVKVWSGGWWCWRLGGGGGGVMCVIRVVWGDVVCWWR